MLKWWAKFVFSDFSLQKTILQLFAYFCANKGYLSTNGSAHSLARGDGYMQAVLLATEFIIFIVFDFKKTSINEAKAPVFGEICQISCASMEFIKKASIKALDHLIFVIDLNLETSNGE